LLVLGLLFLLTIAPVISMIVGSFMFRAGFFELNTVWTTQHWHFILNDSQFLNATFTTLKLALTAAVVSPLLFSVIAYLIVRTRLPGRNLLDTIIWISGGIPGILSGLGLMWLFLANIPGTEIKPLLPLFGTMWALILVVVVQGNTTGVNILKGAFVQIGSDMEEAARVAGAGWVETYFKIWLPLLMPTLILLATFNFVIAAGTTSSIILLASRDTVTLSLLALEYSEPGIAKREAASIVSLIVIALTVGIAVLMRAYGLRMGITHEQQHIRTGMRIGGEKEEHTTRTSTRE
jgi:iron(III) transport system permease protein